MNVWMKYLVTGMALCVSAAAWAGNGSWTSNGPDGGEIYDIAIDPSNKLRMYAATQGGLFRSTDGGVTWQFSGDGLPYISGINGIAIDVEAPMNLYVFGDNRLYRSSDGAETWAATGYAMPAGTWFPVIADVPGNTGSLVVAFSSDENVVMTGLMKTTDHGATFSPLGSGLPANINVNGVSFDPDDASRMLLTRRMKYETFAAPVAFPDVVYRSTDGGQNWVAVHAPPDPVTYIDQEDSKTAQYGAGTRAYTLTQSKLWRSTDDGATWSNAGLSNQAYQYIKPHPTLADTLYAIDYDRRLQISSDGGATFTQLGNTSANSSYTSHLDPTKTLRSELKSLTLTPDFPSPGSSMWLASGKNGVYRSGDAGATWATSSEGIHATKIRAVAVHPNPETAGGAGTDGSGRKLYAGYGDAFFASPALFTTSGAAGMDWSASNQQLRATNVRELFIDPTTTGSVIADVSNTHMYAAGLASYTSGYENGGPIYKSIDGGSTWAPAVGGLPTTDRFGTGVQSVHLGTVRNIIGDPRSCATPPAAPAPCGVGHGALQTLYASASGFSQSGAAGTGITRKNTHRLLKTTDAAGTWVDLSENPGFAASVTRIVSVAGSDYRLTESVTPIGIQISPNDPDTLYVSTYTSMACDMNNAARTPCPDGFHAAQSDPETGMFKSTDGGATWMGINNGIPPSAGFTNARPFLLDLLIHPTDANTLWVAYTDSEFNHSAASAQSIFKTTDGGATWVPSSAGIPSTTDIRALVIDQNNPDILYASGSGTTANPGSVYKSVDGGTTWRSISIGMPENAALSLAVDPFNAQVLHAGTTSGLWSITQLPDMDGDGVPDAVEDAGPNGGDSNNDGIRDAEQPDVSVVGASAGAAAPASSFAKQMNAGGFITVKTEAITGQCKQIVDMTRFDSLKRGHDYLQNGTLEHVYPNDLLRFEIQECSEAKVDLAFHDKSFADQYGWSFRMHGPSTPGDDKTMGWHALGEVAERVNANTWRLNLKAGSFGNYRPGNQSILFEGGAACMEDRIGELGFENDQTFQTASCRP